MPRARQPKKTLRDDLLMVVARCAGLNSRLAARRISQFLDRELAPTGLTIAQLGLMARIAVASDDTLGALARRGGVDQSTLSRNLRVLEAGGLVETAVVEADLRRRSVWLTEAGLRRLEAALPLWHAAGQKLGEAVPADLAYALAEATEALDRDDD